MLMLEVGKSGTIADSSLHVWRTVTIQPLPVRNAGTCCENAAFAAAVVVLLLDLKGLCLNGVRWC